MPEKVARQLEHELALIAELDYAPYFLTVHDIVRYARAARRSSARAAARRRIRRSAIASASPRSIPTQIDLLFERFVSAERNEPPDIDVDFEHERREEVIQYIYEKYGRDRAGIAATVICYRPRGAMREVGKALGLSEDVTAALAGTVWGWGSDGIDERPCAREPGSIPTIRPCAWRSSSPRELIGFPRHLSQHVGGFVITRGPLDEVVPIENAAMEDRTVIEWDKDDLDALGILKVDVLALGMLTCIRRAFDLIEQHYGRALDARHRARARMPEVYDMLCQADSVGVFQVESRAQMTMLPRLKPRKFYDLVIEVAIVRPGPIQGDMVHPYLRRRDGIEPVEYPVGGAARGAGARPWACRSSRSRRCGSPWSPRASPPAEADRLRRAMATFRHNGNIPHFREQVHRRHGRRTATSAISPSAASIRSRASAITAFPESHAASFALLVYVSAWIKCYPSRRSSPPRCSTASRWASTRRRRSCATRASTASRSGRSTSIDSDWDCTLEPPTARRRGAGEARAAPGLAPGQGLRRGRREGARRGARAALSHAGRAGAAGGPKRGAMERLAAADAFRSLGLDRRQALWAVKGLDDAAPPLLAALEDDGAPEMALPAMSLGEHVATDYVTLGLSLKRHPLALLRDKFDPRARRAGARLKDCRPTAASRSRGWCWCASGRGAPAASSS